LTILHYIHETLHTNWYPIAGYFLIVLSLFNSETTRFLHCTCKFLQKFFISLIRRNINAIETKTQYKQIMAVYNLTTKDSCSVTVT